jgi:hypothetical protein
VAIAVPSNTPEAHFPKVRRFTARTTTLAKKNNTNTRNEGKVASIATGIIPTIVPIIHDRM